jgi:hypothetical protein
MSRWVHRNSEFASVPKKPVEPQRDSASAFENVKPMYYELHFFLNGCPDVYDFRLFYNSDETMLVLDESAKNVKVVTRLDNYDNEVVSGMRIPPLTLFFTICADGKEINPVVISKAKTPNDEFQVVFFFSTFLYYFIYSQLKDTWGWALVYNGVGWNTQIDLLEICDKYIFPKMDQQRKDAHLEHKRIFYLLDGHVSRDSLQLIELAVFIFSYYVMLYS